MIQIKSKKQIHIHIGNVLITKKIESYGIGSGAIIIIIIIIMIIIIMIIRLMIIMVNDNNG